MAFRIKTKTSAILIFGIAISISGAAPPAAYEVQHKHLHGSGPGTLRVDDQSITFEEPGNGKHSLKWKFDDIQQLVLGDSTLRLVSYEDNRRQFGRDRVYSFEQLPATFVAVWYPFFRDHLDQRFVAAIADDQVQAEWQIPAKLVEGRIGWQGTILVGSEEVVFQCESAGHSRSWRISDLTNVSSSGGFDLSMTTHEKDFRFQLKQHMPEAHYRDLWMRINESNGLQILKSDFHQGEKQ